MKKEVICYYSATKDAVVIRGLEDFGSYNSMKEAEAAFKEKFPVTSAEFVWTKD